MSLAETNPARQGRRFARIREAVTYSGVSRSGLYALAIEHAGLFVKHRTSTLVDLDKLDRLLDALPPAKLKAPEAA